MYSGLLFSDGMLQTYEIFNLGIDAELTVLSACQTGLGELKAGEGLVGLTRAFMYAGSPSVLVSLWSVSDPSTAAFMRRFYRNLNKGKTKAEALRETKIWMKEKSYHTDEHGNVIKHNQPFYWAPFILAGAHE
jgi:CHAT domain-containing protein